MAVKSVDMVRKIRDKHYEETKDLSAKEQIKFIKGKSRSLQERLVARAGKHSSITQCRQSKKKG